MAGRVSNLIPRNELFHVEQIIHRTLWVAPQRGQERRSGEYNVIVAAPAQPDRFRFLHIDLNSFFASVEQQIHPEYRNKPLGVCGTMADTGALIAASYEAKALGIKTLTKVGEAKRLCPDIILVNGSHTVYSQYSHNICKAVERCCPVAHTPSIDEMVCELIGQASTELPNARRIALEIKQAIKDDVGETLRCSIGMAPNRYLAKIASDMQKPDGLIGLLPSAAAARDCAPGAARPAGGGGAHGNPAERQGHLGRWSSCWRSTGPGCTRFGTACGATGYTTGCAARIQAMTARR